MAPGIGLRQPHYREVLERQPALGFVEVHSENFFLEGGAALHALERVRSAYPLSFHGVGLSLGSADALASSHLDRLKRLVERFEPALVSEHLCWGGLDGSHYNDLLPLPYTAESLAMMVARVQHVQDTLRRPILVENLSAYVEFRASEMSETTFLAELARQSGCGVLLDLNNLHVNAVNFGFDAHARLGELSAEAIGEIHLAGHHVGDDCLIDTHDAPVGEAVWGLYAAACERFGPKPTLIEWDAQLPALDVLLGESQTARAIQRDAMACLEAAHG